ncbi:SDR family NAD(P)-dependent oxidoreductase [Arthrobacter sp. FW305-BF8]|uniref:SDR family NAD(P)-dependent oxidoreductase n=1 Tax=Arthrobacter sp. FW305-BF8 TaxID=2879617 RepID=UPI001F28A9DA|nr:SDR family NAD(P)-dependent oxidoreductase [Arthrobacter sp. FW305-BF8]UKA52940.1 SDR family NAD(P)-dependent oxidoreductase [Arthrobacter sp. FW305-BF8]
MNYEDIKGKTVVVTGADGFIGSHVTQRLIAEGANVRALCVYNSNGSYGWLDDLTPAERDAVDLQLGDIRDSEFVSDLVKGSDVVLHLAALIAIPYSYQAPRSYVETNVVGTLNVLEGVRRHGVGRLVNTSTSEVYGTPKTVPITIDNELRGQSPYSATKIAADKLCEAWASSFETPVVVLRPFNTYGPRQSARAVIPTVLQQMVAGAEKIHLGSLSPRRDFTFVSDTADGFVKAATAEIPLKGQVIQLGTGYDVTIGDLVEMSAKVTGSTAEIITQEERVRPEASEVMHLLSDPSQALAELGWAPQVGLEEGLRQTAEWIKARGVDASAAAKYSR